MIALLMLVVGLHAPLQTNQLIQALAKAGCPVALRPTFVAIGMAESGGGRRPYGDYYRRQGYTSFGIWQIHTRDRRGRWVNKAGAQPFDEHRLAVDAVYNAQAALIVYRRQGLIAWSTYRHGLYLRFLRRI